MNVKWIPLSLVLAGCLAGQAVDQQATVETLTTSLRALQDSSNETLASHRDRINKDILSLAEDSHRPPMYTVATFTARLTEALAGKQVSAVQASAIATEIDTVLHSAGLGTWRFKEAISDLQAALQSMGASAAAAKKAAMALEVVGKEIRGPEGMPVRPLN